MQTIVTFINTGLAIYCAVLAQKRYNSTVVMILVLIASYALFRAFGQLFLLYYYKHQGKKHPFPTLHTFKEENWEDRDEWEDSYLDLGWRAMVVTEELADDKYIEYYQRMLDEAVEHFNQPQTIFELRLNHVHKRRLPFQAVYSVCGTDGVEINTTAKAWYSSRALSKLASRREPNKDIFIYDGTMDIEGVGPTAFTVFIAFERRLPVTINNKFLKKEETQAIEEAPAEDKTTEEQTQAAE